MSDDHLTTEEECPDCSGFDRCDFHEGVRRGRQQVKKGDGVTLEEKLERLEEAGVAFRAAYYGKEEVFTACFPDGMFIDFNWLESNDSGDVQFVQPTELERVVDETLEWLENGEHDER